MRSLRAWLLAPLLAAACAAPPADGDVDDGAAAQTASRAVDDPVLYVGMNSVSRAHEISGLRASVDVVAVTGRTPNGTVEVDGVALDLATEAGIDAFVAHFAELDDAGRSEVRAMVSVHPKLRTSLDEIAQLLLAFYDAETSGRPIRRVALSGHSSGSSLSGEALDDGTLQFFTLERLQALFPKAVASVEHLAISGCYTASKELEPQRFLFDQYVAAFPRVRSIWAYKGTSPTIPWSTRHLVAWETGTRRDATVAKLDAARRTAGRWGGGAGSHVRVWRSDGSILGE